MLRRTREILARDGLRVAVRHVVGQLALAWTRCVESPLAETYFSRVIGVETSKESTGAAETSLGWDL